MNIVGKDKVYYDKFVEPFIEENDLSSYPYEINGDELHWKVDLFEGYYIDYYFNLSTHKGDIIFREPFGDGYNSSYCDVGGALYLRGY